MLPSQNHWQESFRIETLHKYQILNTPSEKFFRNLAELAVKTFGCVLGIISFVDAEEVFYKEVVVNHQELPNFTGARIPLSQSPCAFAVHNPEVTILDRYPDQHDPLHAAYHVQVSQFGLKFYAGAPLRTSDGYSLGMFAIVDTEARAFSERDRDLLVSLAKIVMDELELRTKLLQESEKKTRLIETLAEQTQELELNARVINEKNDLITTLNHHLQKTNSQLEEANLELAGRVTEKSRKLLRALKALVLSQKELETIVYNSSHGLKAPISTLQGLTNLAKAEVQDNLGLAYLSKIETLTSRMQNNIRKVTMIHDLLKRKASEEVRHLDHSDFETLLVRTVEQFKKEIDKQQIQVSMEVSPFVCLAGSVKYFQFILENLFENAILYARNNSGQEKRIDIRISETGQDLVLTFFDNGDGIPEAALPHLFEMFYRASDKAVGPGLGLYIVYHSVKKMHGTIQVASVVGQFTTFTVTLPKYGSVDTPYSIAAASSPV